MRRLLKEQFKHFKKQDFYPGSRIIEAVQVFMAWSVPAFLFVIWATIYHPEVTFYQEAIRQGIGPNLWHVIGSFGFFVFGIAVVFSRYSLFSVVAKKILSNTFAMGSLTFGLVFGQWCILFGQDDLIWWERGLYGITSGLLLIIFVILNFVIWYMSFLIENNGKIKSVVLIKLDQVHWIWKFILGLGFCTLITYAFFAVK